MITIPDFLTFLANNTIIALLAPVAWIFVVAAVVWLGEKAVKKFRQQASAGEQASARRKPGMEPEAAE
jgi:ascorbate-specific PTS system EIIC-type component UlaA